MCAPDGLRCCRAVALMCLAAVVWKVHPRFPLVVAANRDEFYARPTAPLAWQDGVLAGRDLQAGGTWMGVKGGRWALVTNVRNPADLVPGRASRGELPLRWLASGQAATGFWQSLDPQQYAGFNLLMGDAEELWWASNRAAGPVRLEPGCYGLSNAALDTPWPKLRQLRSRLLGRVITATSAASLAAGILEELGDPAMAPDEELPDTGVGLAWERQLSATFIRTPLYGTRCSTVMVREPARTEVWERSFVGETVEDRQERF